MKNLFVKQGIFLPLFYFGTILVAALFAENYSHFGQHASELGINSSITAKRIFEFGAYLTGVSLILFSFGLIKAFKSQYPITAVLIFIFGVNFLFGAFFPIGSPWHGAYGIALSVVLLPPMFLYETKGFMHDSSVRWASVAVAVLILIYFWGIFTRLDPIDLRGLTQRLFGIAVFFWLSFIAYKLTKLK